MKKLILAIAVAGAVLIWGMSASAVNITIWDTIGTSPSGGANGENNEVEPGCELSQRWDMEAFLFDTSTKKLQMQGGYNMVNGEFANDWNQTFYSGDIFIDVNGDAKWGSAINFDHSPDKNGYYVTGNAKYGWDYAIVFDRAPVGSKVPNGGSTLTGGYKVYQLSGASDVEVFFDQNNNANPFRYLKGGSEVVGKGGTVTQTSGNPAGVNGDGPHYVLGDIDLSFLAGLGTAPNLTFHFAEGCGNDLLMGQTTSFSTPDGGLTVALLGMSLAALRFASRRLRKN